MTWTYLDDGFPEHPKVIAAGGDAAWLFVAGLCWSRRHQAAGEIPKAIVGRLTDRKNARKIAGKLVEVGLWIDKGDHYAVHHYDDWNGSEEVEREKRRERATKAAETRWARAKATPTPDARSNARASTKHVPEQSPSNAPSNAQAMPHAGGGARVPLPSLNNPSVVNSSNAPEPADGNGHSRNGKAPPAHPDQAVLDNIGRTISWTTPRRRAELATVWNYGLTVLDRRVLEETLLACTDARHPNYLRQAITARATTPGGTIR